MVAPSTFISAFAARCAISASASANACPGWRKVANALLTKRRTTGNSVQKLEDKTLGNWIDVHEAQTIVEQAQDRISELREELGAAKGEYDRAANKMDALQLRLNAADRRAKRQSSRL
jgi:molecular chaperone GrpE (heat shock protein)